MPPLSLFCHAGADFAITLMLTPRIFAIIAYFSRYYAADMPAFDISFADFIALLPLPDFRYYRFRFSLSFHAAFAIFIDIFHIIFRHFAISLSLLFRFRHFAIFAYIIILFHAAAIFLLSFIVAYYFATLPLLRHLIAAAAATPPCRCHYAAFAAADAAAIDAIFAELRHFIIAIIAGFRYAFCCRLLPIIAPFSI